MGLIISTQINFHSLKNVVFYEDSFLQSTHEKNIKSHKSTCNFMCEQEFFVWIYVRKHDKSDQDMYTLVWKKKGKRVKIDQALDHAQNLVYREFYALAVDFFCATSLVLKTSTGWQARVDPIPAIPPQTNSMPEQNNFHEILLQFSVCI